MYNVNADEDQAIKINRSRDKNKTSNFTLLGVKSGVYFATY
jgi:hypothetical protein